MKPLYIFDLDGTLADITHRRHFVENRANCWDEFYAACVNDSPNTSVIQVMNLLRRNADIWIFSGRSDIVRVQTQNWLHTHTELNEYDIIHCLTMRTDGNYTPDDILKKYWYDRMLDVDKARLVATFDDRDRIVKMWRNLGVTCFQVAPGDF